MFALRFWHSWRKSVSFMSWIVVVERTSFVGLLCDIYIHIDSVALVALVPMSVDSLAEIGLPHLVYLTDEGVFSSVCTVKVDSDSEPPKGFWASFCCCFSLWKSMPISNEKQISRQLPAVCMSYAYQLLNSFFEP